MKDNFFTKNFKYIVVFLLVFLLLSQCTDKRNSNRRDKDIKSNLVLIEAKLDTIIHHIENFAVTTDDLQKNMFDFLLYEDELDKGKISLTGIKDKIEADNKQ